MKEPTVPKMTARRLVLAGAVALEMEVRKSWLGLAEAVPASRQQQRRIKGSCLGCGRETQLKRPQIACLLLKPIGLNSMVCVRNK